MGFLFDLFDPHPNATAIIALGHDLVRQKGKPGEYAITPTQISAFLAFAVGLFILREVLARLFFVPMGRKLVGDNRPIFVEKWVENCWFCVFYPISFCLGLYVVHDQPFFTNPYHYYTDFPIISTGHRNSVPFMLYYAMGFGFYLQSIVALVTFETRRKDFWIMFAHHFATIVLMAVSWSTAHDRIGSMVLLLHDFVDIFLYFGKGLHYIKAEGAKTVAFVFFVLSYFTARMVFFPMKIIYSVSIAVQCCIGSTFLVKYVPNSRFYGELSTYGLCVGHYCFSMYWYLTGFMCFLYALHVYWFYLVIKMVIAAIKTKGIDQDIRSDSEDEAIERERQIVEKMNKNKKN